MRLKSVIGAAVVAVCLGVVVTSVVSAGPLDPPAGPIESTDAVLLNQQDVTFPIAITEPGVYRLTSDLVLPSSPIPRNGIVIGADNVTIDLNGFALRNPNGSGDAISPEPPSGSNVTYHNITIKNGTIDNWFMGVEPSRQAGLLNFATLTDMHLVDVTIRECTFAGELRSGARVERCRIFDNATGIDILGGGTITDCDVYDNGSYNISVRIGCTVKGCRVQGGSGVGILVGPSGDQNQILDNTITGCAGVGLDVSAGQDHTAYRNIITDCAAPGVVTSVQSDAPFAGSASGATTPLANIVR